MTAGASVQGRVEPGFEPVREAFQENLDRRGELGAACALLHEGRLVVDLWGGVRDPRRAAPWEADTLALVYSVAKGVSAMVCGLLHDRGQLDYDEPVATYWPAFAQNGKADITVRQLLDHEAGLAAIDERLDPALLADADQMAAILERQRPSHPPGERHTYHAISLGFYQSELVRRIDPAGRTLGRFLTEELAVPLDAECYIGLPADVPPARVAPIESLSPFGMVLHPKALSPRLIAAIAWPWSLTARALRNPKLSGPAALDAPAFRAVEMPASNAITNARSLVRLYGAFLEPAAASDASPAVHLSAATKRLYAAPTRLPPAGGWDQVFQRHTAFTLGFMKPCRDFRFGSSERAFGAPGLGGSFAFADPDTRSAYAYVTNRLGYSVFDEPRERALRAACDACLRTLSPA